MANKHAWVGLVCLVGGVLFSPSLGCRGVGGPPPIPLELPERPAGTLVFPPPDGGWEPRAALGDGHGGFWNASNALRVREPVLDARKHFEVTGQVVRIELDDDAVGDPKDTKLPLVAVTPAVPGRTVWTSRSTVELRADRPFDPATEYTVRLPEIVAPSKKTLVGGFEGTFKAKPVVEIAGKTIHYLPQPGVPRVVYVRPGEDSDIGPGHELVVIYDQPIDLAVAQPLLTMTDDKDRKVPLALRHPTGDTFEGIKVDPRVLVLARMASPPRSGTALRFAAKGRKDGDEAATRAFKIPDLPLYKGMECNECQVKGNLAKGPSSNWGVGFEFTNSLGWHDMKKFVRVTPTPPNFSASGEGQRLGVHGSWAAGATYAISISGATDRFGFALPPVQAIFQVLPRAANTVMRDGVQMLDEAHARDFFVTTRNVKKGMIDVWPVEPGSDALEAALRLSRRNEVPSSPNLEIPFDGNPTPNVYVETRIDLTRKLEPGRAYLARARTVEGAYGAPVASGSGYTTFLPSVPLLFMARKDAVGAHVHAVADRAIVQAYRMGTGEPAAGVSLVLGAARATTDAAGTALLDLGKPRADDGARGAASGDGALVIKDGAIETLLPFTDKTRTDARSLYPELVAIPRDDPGAGEGDAPADLRAVGFVITDKGIYRPGSVIQAKGIVRRGDGQGVVAVKRVPVRLHVTDASGGDVIDEALTTSDAGTVAREIPLAAGARTGRYHVRLETDARPRTLLYDEIVRVAEFETPRFKVDVEPRDGAVDRLQARIVGRYFFGAPMSGADVRWSLRKRAAPVKGGPLGAAGLAFGAESTEYDGWGAPPPKDELKPVTGEGKLGPDGALDVSTVLGPLAKGPTLVVLEADVTDASYRHVANRTETIKHPHTRYGGLKLERQWGDLGPLNVDLGVVDTTGKAVVGANVEARLDRIEWKREAARGESGAVLESYRAMPTPAGTCAVTSDTGPRRCAIDVKRGGSYRVTARVDGHDDGSVTFYAYGGGGDAAAVPSAGKKVPVRTDRKSYRPGDTARILVQNPFADATAILAVQQGALLRHEVRRVRGGATTFDVPLTLANAPFSHAEVTLLPIGAQEPGYRVGAVRIPVGLDETRLAVSVVSAKKMYDAGESVDVTVEVKRGQEPVRGADLTLAIVDEAILRLTNHHAKDPTEALHPPRPLGFSAVDSRELLFRRREKAHVAGGGSSEEADLVDTRKDFVETLAWLPALTTDASGRATARVKLKDNLTEFRMMATVVDASGGAGVAENGFVVARPFLLDPVMPGFALAGDRLEIAAMVHNNTDRPIVARVRVVDQTNDVPVPARSRAKVVAPLVADVSRKLSFSLEVDGKLVDRVERGLDVQAPGSAEHPTLSGVFRDLQVIDLAIPGDAVFPPDAKLVLKTGSALYPELGHRLAYLLDYPPGCVEQTTSGTLPLLAARKILPWTGAEPLSDDEIQKRIKAGVKRLASMRTDSGALAYWPGGTEPHVYGTVYATRALIRAKELGVEEAGLLTGALEFLRDRLKKENDPVIKVSIAEVLAQAGKLPEASADNLYDTRDRLDAFGLASLALALSTLPKQDDRVAALLDKLEDSFDERGASKVPHGKGDYHYWGSNDRDRAQALIALSKLRRGSPLVARFARQISQRVETYATQSVAWSLMGFADFVGSEKPRGTVDVSVVLPGILFDVNRKLGGENKEVRIPLSALRGKRVTLRLEGDRATPSAFAMEARYTRPYATAPKHARREAKGPSVYRVYTDPFGRAIDPGHVKAGDVVRVALRADLSGVADWRQRYFALTDRFPAGFEPVNPDLATVAQAPEISRDHPFHDGLAGGGHSGPSHLDLRTDRVNVYFDHVYGHATVYATYLLRATTPGEYVLPCAKGELMYEPGSEGYSESGKVVVTP